MRPLRLSSFSWASRCKTCHRLLLNWKGQDRSDNKTQQQPGPQLLKNGHHPSSTSHPVVQPHGRAPIHIAVVCPEPEPPPSPSFDNTLGFDDVGRHDSGRGTREEKRERVNFTVGIRVVGPPRVVLEGRWVGECDMVLTCVLTVLGYYCTISWLPSQRYVTVFLGSITTLDYRAACFVFLQILLRNWPSSFKSVLSSVRYGIGVQDCVGEPTLGSCRRIK